MTKSLQDEMQEAFVEQFVRSEQQIRAFVRSLLPPWADADEAMQDVVSACWRNFSDLKTNAGFHARESRC